MSKLIARFFGAIRDFSHFVAEKFILVAEWSNSHENNPDNAAKIATLKSELAESRKQRGDEKRNNA